MPLQDELLYRRRNALFGLLSCGAPFCLRGRVRRQDSFVPYAGVAVVFLLRFLRANDEREQQINYQALTFAFTGTLIFSLAIGFLQSFGFHTVSWLGIPVLMVILWSVGLILYSWRYQ